jgi:hypothetical protein
MQQCSFYEKTMKKNYIYYQITMNASHHRASMGGYVWMESTILPAVVLLGSPVTFARQVFICNIVSLWVK